MVKTTSTLAFGLRRDIHQEGSAPTQGGEHVGGGFPKSLGGSEPDESGVLGSTQRTGGARPSLVHGGYGSDGSDYDEEESTLPPVVATHANTDAGSKQGSGRVSSHKTNDITSLSNIGGGSMQRASHVVPVREEEASNDCQGSGNLAQKIPPPGMFGGPSLVAVPIASAHACTKRFEVNKHTATATLK